MIINKKKIFLKQKKKIMKLISFNKKQIKLKNFR